MGDLKSVRAVAGRGWRVTNANHAAVSTGAWMRPLGCHSAVDVERR